MKSENQKETDLKGKKRMEKYERRISEPEKDDDSKSITFWEKLGDDGNWEKKEYVYRTK